MEQIRHRHGPVRADTVERTDQRMLSQFTIPSGKVVAQLAVIRAGTKWQIEDLAECSTRPAPTSPDLPITQGPTRRYKPSTRPTGLE